MGEVRHTSFTLFCSALWHLSVITRSLLGSTVIESGAQPAPSVHAVLRHKHNSQDHWGRNPPTLDGVRDSEWASD